MKKNHSPRFLELVKQAQSRIREISPLELKEMLDVNSVVLLDVREENEWNQGHIPGAIHLSKGVLERDIEKIQPDLGQALVVYCSGGFRCALAADSLQKMGYIKVYSLAGGSGAWVEKGYPFVRKG